MKIRHWFSSQCLFAFVLIILLNAFSLPSFAYDQGVVADLLEQIDDADDGSKAALYLALSEAYGLDAVTSAYEAAEQAMQAAEAQGQRLQAQKALLLAARWKRYLNGPRAELLERVEAMRREALKVNETEIALGALITLTEYALDGHEPSRSDSLLALAQEEAEAIQNDHLQARTLLAFARHQDLFGESSGLSAYEDASAALLKCGDISSALSSHSNIMAIYHRRRDKLHRDSILEQAFDIIEDTQSDYWQCRFHLQYGRQLMRASSDSNSALLWNQSADLLAELCPTVDNPLMSYHYSVFLARLARKNGDRKESFRYTEISWEQAHGLDWTPLVVDAGFFMAYEYGHLREQQKALEILLSLQERVFQHDYKVDRFYGQVQNSYQSTGDHAQAVEYGLKSLAYNRRTGNVKPRSQQYTGLAIDYREMDSFDLALTYYDSALTLAIQRSIPQYVVGCHTGRGYIHILQERHDLAELELKSAIQHINVNPDQVDPEYISYTYSMASRIYKELGQYDRSISYATEAMEINERINWTKALKDNYEMLAEVYEKKNDYKEANEYWHKFNVLKDSLFQIEAEKEVLSLKEEFESEQKEMEINLLESENQLNELSLQAKEDELVKSQQALWMVGGLVVLVLILALWFFNRYKLKQRAKELDRENNELRLREENIQAQQQLAMAELRTSLITNVSHDIRTPLTLIKGPLEKLRDDPSSINPEIIERMERNTDRLITLVNQTLAFSASDADHLPLKPKSLPLATLLTEVCETFSAQAIQKEVRLQVVDHTGKMRGMVDPDLIERAISNLLSNALRFTSKGDRIIVTLSQASQSESEDFVITVADTGGGISERHLPYLFDRHYKVGEEDADRFGLGLAITKSIVEQHHGKISVASKLDQGTTFTIVIPFVAAEAASLNQSVQPDSEPKAMAVPSESTAAAPDSPRTQILIVEDHEELRQYLLETLSGEYDVRSAPDGIEGIRLAKEHNPDLIVSDVMMPGKDGFELTQSIKQDLETSHIPVLLLTARSAQSDKIHGLQMGADDYLLKPFSPEELLLRIKNQVTQRERFRALFSREPVRALSQSNTLSKLDQAFLEKAKQAVEKHIDNEDFTVDQFCKELALNRTSVHLKMKSLTGKNTTGFIRSIRIEKALSIIHSEEYSMMDVATLSGFSNRRTFTRAFKEQVGITPKEYREQA